MKKLIAIVLMLSLLCALITVSAAAAPEEIKYDFDSADELNDWQSAGGSWKIEDGLLKQTSGTPGSWNMHCCLKDVQVKDFTVRLRIKVAKENLGTGWAALYFRKLNLTDNQEQSGYGLTMEGKSSKGKTVLVDWAHSCKTFEGQCRSNGNEWNEIVLAVAGNTVKVYMNDDIATKTATLEIVDNENGWMDAGYLSLAAGNAKIEVDYFYLYTGNSQSKAFSGAASTDPTDPQPTDPQPTDPQPTEPQPTEPQPTEPQPTEPQPTEPQPTEPQPTEPQPTEPQPTEPQPTEPQPTDPQPTEPQPTDPQPTEPQPTEPKPDNSLSMILLIVGVGGIACVVAIYLISNKRKKG